MVRCREVNAHPVAGPLVQIVSCKALRQTRHGSDRLKSKMPIFPLKGLVSEVRFRVSCRDRCGELTPNRMGYRVMGEE